VADKILKYMFYKFNIVSNRLIKLYHVTHYKMFSLQNLSRLLPSNSTSLQVTDLLLACFWLVVCRALVQLKLNMIKQ